MYFSLVRREATSEYGTSEFFTASYEVPMATYQQLRGYAVREPSRGTP